MWSRKCGSQGKERKEDISDAGQPWHRREIHQSANSMKPELGCAQRRSGLARARSFSKVILFSGVIWRWTAEELVCAQQLHKQLLLMVSHHLQDKGQLPQQSKQGAFLTWPACTFRDLSSPSLLLLVTCYSCFLTPVSSPCLECSSLFFTWQAPTPSSGVTRNVLFPLWFPHFPRPAS